MTDHSPDDTKHRCKTCKTDNIPPDRDYCRTCRKSGRAMAHRSSTETDHSTAVIDRLEEALERQQNTEGEIASTPTVVYCFDCDEITVDSWTPEGCLDHRTVSSDGYDHDGIGAAITALRFVRSSTKTDHD